MIYHQGSIIPEVSEKFEHGINLLREKLLQRELAPILQLRKLIGLLKFMYLANYRFHGRPIRYL
jgi:hypothetical protein